MGSFLAVYADKFNWIIFGLACLTTILLQVLSNFANDYGDTQNGADTLERVGPLRSVQTGEIPAQRMFKAIVLFGVLSLFSGVALLYYAFKTANAILFIGFLALGLLSILAAYTYTAGKKPYGYAGLGDISVLIFFGLVGVLGSNFLFTKSFDITNILPAISCGLLATGVLNLNNIRDIDSDIKAGKMTIPARLGKEKSLIYHYILLSFAIICIISFVYLKGDISWWFLLSIPLFLMNAIMVKKLSNPDLLLKQLALYSLFFVLLFGVSVLF
jgi:1,4-dihydroxy-2-naphthoate octaprenyltransferase